MNLWQRVTHYFEKRSMTDGQLYNLMLGGASTYAGPAVNEDSAMRYGAVYACIRIISESIASLPLVLYKQSGRNKTKATTHPLYPILHDLANPLMTALEWRELMLSHTLAWGNGYSEKEMNGFGQTVALWPLNPAKMEDVQLVNGEAWYFYRLPDNTLQRIPGYRIHHLKGLGNGLIGHSPISVAAKQAIGLGLAAEEYGSRFYSNGARPGLILRHPGKLSDKAKISLRESFNSEHQGLSNAHRTKVLEEGMDVTAIGIPNNEAQFLETRKFQVTEIARIYRVPPHMLGDLDRATFSNIEQQSINFVMYTLMPWLVRHEQAIYRDLLNESDRKTIFAKYIVEGMLRGDALSRYQSYQLAINNTILTPNEIRELEDRNPVDGGDKLFTPLNMIALGEKPPTPAPAPTPARNWSDQSAIETRAQKLSNDRRGLMNRNVRLFEEAAGRAVKRETADIRKAAKSKLGTRSADGFETWLEDFYKQLRVWFPEYFRSLMLTYAESMMAAVAAELDGEPAPLDESLRAWVEEYLANYTEVYAVGGEKQLRALLADTQDNQMTQTVILERLDGWDATKAGKEGFDQAFEAGNALSVFGYLAAGLRYLTWHASGRSCPLCNKMDGRKAKIDGYFLKQGDTVHADGVDPLPVVRNMKHAPLHRGCDCVVLGE
jgi:HK97 family phage portal protein